MKKRTVESQPWSSGRSLLGSLEYSPLSNSMGGPCVCFILMVGGGNPPRSSPVLQ